MRGLVQPTVRPIGVSSFMQNYAPANALTVTSSHTVSPGAFSEIWSAAASTEARVVEGFTWAPSSYGASGEVLIQLAIGGSGAETVIGEMWGMLGRWPNMPVPLYIPAGTRFSVRLLDTSGLSSAAFVLRSIWRSPLAYATQPASSWVTKRAALPTNPVTITASLNLSWQEVFDATFSSVSLAIVGMQFADGGPIHQFAFGASGSEVIVSGSDFFPTVGTLRLSGWVIVPPLTRLTIRNALPDPLTSRLMALQAVTLPLPQTAY